MLVMRSFDWKQKGKTESIKPWTLQVRDLNVAQELTPEVRRLRKLEVVALLTKASGSGAAAAGGGSSASTLGRCIAVDYREYRVKRAQGGIISGKERTFDREKKEKENRSSDRKKMIGS